MVKKKFCNFGIEFKRNGTTKRLGCCNEAKFELPDYNVKKDTPVRCCSLHLARTLNEGIVWLADSIIEIKKLEQSKLQAGEKKA